MAVSLSDLRAGRPLPPRAIVRLKGLRQLKNPVTSSGVETAKFRVPQHTICSLKTVTLYVNLNLSVLIKCDVQNALYKR
jgi:hypothetical protein